MSESADRPAYLHAAVAVGAQMDYLPEQRRLLRADPPAAELKELTRRVTGQSLRQASHFVELAAIGSQLCLQRLRKPMSSDTAVYLGTGLAEVRKTRALFAQVMPPGPGCASPFDFINSANNMAAFYVAKLAGITGRNLTVMAEEFSFEQALMLAASDLCSQECGAVLVGGVDENSYPRDQHLRHIELRDSEIMGEGSSWLYLTREREGALGELLTVEALPALPIHTSWVDAMATHLDPLLGRSIAARLLPGFRLAQEDVAALAGRFPTLEPERYLEYCGSFFSAAAFGIATAFEGNCASPRLFLHVNRDAAGATMIVALRVFGSGD